MQSTRNLTTTGSYGYELGADFDDLVGIPNINTTAISRMVVTHDQHIESLTVGFNGIFVRYLLIARKVHYSDKVGVRRGGSSSTSSEFTITPGEFVTKVEGTFLGSAISKIAFWTNKGT